MRCDALPPMYRHDARRSGVMDHGGRARLRGAGSGTIGPRTAHDLGGDNALRLAVRARSCWPISWASCCAGHWSDRQGPAQSCTRSGRCSLPPACCSAAWRRRGSSLRRRPGGAGTRRRRRSDDAACVTIGRAYTESERPRQFALLSSAWVIARPRWRRCVGGIDREAFGWRLGASAAMSLSLPVAALLRLRRCRALPLGRAADDVAPLASSRTAACCSARSC